MLGEKLGSITLQLGVGSCAVSGAAEEEGLKAGGAFAINISEKAAQKPQRI